MTTDKSDWDGYKEGYDKGYSDGYIKGVQDGAKPLPVSPYHPWSLINTCSTCGMNISYMQGMTCVRIDCPNENAYSPMVTLD